MGIDLKDDFFIPKEFNMQWHITGKCNLNCKHCYKDSSLEKKDLPLFKLKKIIFLYHQQIKKWGIEKGNVALIGGEPLVRKDFFDILDEVNKYSDKIYCTLSTNGTLIDSFVAKKLREKKIHSVQISIEGREMINDQIRGKGVFKKILNAVQELKKNKVNLSLATTVSKNNIKEVPYLIDIAKKLKITAISFTRLVPLGNSKDEEKIILSPLEVKNLYKYLIKEEKKNDIHLLGHCEQGIINQIDYINDGCMAGYKHAIIMPDGAMLPCRRLPVYAGNVLVDGFEEIYYNSEIFKKLREAKNTNIYCSKCLYFSHCGGGAKCISYAYYGDFSKPDPQCWKISDDLPAQDMVKKEKIFKKNNIDDI